MLIAYTKTAMNDRIERIESLKAGSLSGITMGIADGAIGGLDRLVTSLAIPSDSLVVEVALAISGGFLFGVTYRYIIRTDRNAHLNSGAVLAFGLVRGLAQVNIRDWDLTEIGANGLIVAENILLFTLARYAIDYALAARWISPFKSS